MGKPTNQSELLGGFFLARMSPPLVCGTNSTVSMSTSTLREPNVPSSCCRPRQEIQIPTLQTHRRRPDVRFSCFFCPFRRYFLSRLCQPTLSCHQTLSRVASFLLLESFIPSPPMLDSRWGPADPQSSLHPTGCSFSVTAAAHTAQYLRPHQDPHPQRWTLSQCLHWYHGWTTFGVLLFRGGHTSLNTFESVIHRLYQSAASRSFAVFGLRLTRFLFLGYVVSPVWEHPKDTNVEIYRLRVSCEPDVTGGMSWSARRTAEHGSDEKHGLKQLR